MPIEEEQPAGIPEWVVTFGDMMSLLLTFFILLFAMSEPKEEETQAMLEALRKQFGQDRTTFSAMPGPNAPLSSNMTKLAALGRARRKDTLSGGDKIKAPVGDFPRVMSHRGDKHATAGIAYFDQGSVELTAEQKGGLALLAELVRGKPQKIEILGHASSHPLPADSPYADHTRLGTARSERVRDYLVELGIDPARFRISSAGNTEPLYISPDPLLQKQNSRVEVVVLPQLTEKLRGTAEEKGRRFIDPEAAPGSSTPE